MSEIALTFTKPYPRDTCAPQPLLCLTAPSLGGHFPCAVEPSTWLPSCLTLKPSGRVGTRRPMGVHLAAGRAQAGTYCPAARASRRNSSHMGSRRRSSAQNAGEWSWRKV